VSGALLVIAACSGGPEYAVLDRFFSASRLRDLTALQRVATVVLEPRRQGTVLAFQITRISAGSAGQDDVLVLADVHTPDGAIEKRPLVATLRRSGSLWMVVDVRDPATSATLATPLPPGGGETRN
jgi:hypothetical protein